MNILIYYPYNQRSVEQQSVMEMFVKKGHNVFLLTLGPEGFLHTYVRKLGVDAYASDVPGDIKFRNIFRNAKLLVRFCKRNKIDIIIAHQQLAALPLIFAKPFINSKVFYVRHNADEDYKKFPVKAWLMNSFINFWTKHIIAPSNVVFNYMTHEEKVPVKKMKRINYGYNFSQYEKADLQKANEIRNKYSCSFLIISIARLVPAKRHILMFHAVKDLVTKGADIKMICLGDGYMKEELETLIMNNKLEQHIFLVGVQSNIFDYLAASDILLHLSESEASNSVVKEAGLAKKTVIVCKNVGDFEDYIIPEQNGFLVNKETPLPETIQVLAKCYSEKVLVNELGNNLYQTVTQKFDIQNVAEQYENLIK